ncbi:MAG: response regulator [Ignavibacteriaceae bacterium]|nr:response regulator [Ignavibacteriaceae bacterium]
MSNILIVEDEKDVRTTIIDLLESAGYTVISAQDGRQAIKIIDYELPDLIISDILMPDVNGYQLLEYFQKLPGTSTIPFIFLTAKTDNTDLRRGMILGADDYLMKPFRAKELLQVVETQLKKKERLDKKFDDIFLNISAFVPHELRTPLIPIIGYAELISEGIDELEKEEICDMANKIKLSSNRLHKTIEKYIRYTATYIKLASKGIYNELKNTCIMSPNSIVECTSKQLLKEASREKDLKLDLIDAQVRISETDFEFVIEELVENALKFSNPGTEISLKSRIKDNLYELDITDHGRGLTKEQLTTITPFSQYDRTKFQQQGNGLGLISVKNLMALYGGNLKITSEINKFTTCSLSIPALNGL